MRPAQTIARLAAFTGRGPGTDAERRAALYLASGLRDAGHNARIETFWCRPNWAFAHAWHAALALAGSLIATKNATLGLVLVLVALISTIADSVTGASIGRRLTPERASQNVVLAAEPQPGRKRLIVTANYDAGRAGLVYGATATAIRGLLRRATNGRAPGWLAWLAIAQAWIAIAAALRLHGTSASTAGSLQVVPTVALVLALALLLETAAASPGPPGNDNASGTALAIALAAERPDAELVLTGAHPIGLRRHLREHRVRRANTIVLGFAASDHGEPHYWRSDGPLLPHASKLTAPDMPPHRNRGWGPAYAAYARHIPTLTLGALGQSDAADPLERVLRKARGVRPA